jgi:hypothetical protein
MREQREHSLLVSQFLTQLATHNRSSIVTVSPDAMKALMDARGQAMSVA